MRDGIQKVPLSTVAARRPVRGRKAHRQGNAINASTPLTNLVLYAGTGSVASSGIPGTATGILKSVDGGNTWSLPVPDANRFFNGGNGLRVTSIVPSRVNPNVVLASTIDATARSEEHTSELQSHSDLVCRLLLEKKKSNLQYFFLPKFTH